MMDIMYTKKQAISTFSEIWRQAVAQNESLATDRPAKSETWNDFTDMLCKDSIITDNQFRNWSNPF